MGGQAKENATRGLNHLAGDFDEHHSPRRDVTLAQRITLTAIAVIAVTLLSAQGFDGDRRIGYRHGVAGTIVGGTGADVYGEGYTQGGGMYNSNSSPTVTNCTFSGNTAVAGGAGMYNEHSSPTVTHCRFTGNIIPPYGRDGAGMSNSYYSSPIVSNCTFNTNVATNGGGGGMSNRIFSNPIINNCTFSENTGSYGGGMYNYESFSTVIHSSFSRNIADSGGALSAGRSSLEVTNCTFNGNTARGDGGGILNNGLRTVSGCTFSGNTAAFDGGGMYNYVSTKVINCTFAGNTAGNSAGGMYNYYYYGSNPTVENCILWGDTPEEIADSIQYAAPVIRFSDVQGGLPLGAVDGGGNIDLDPIFVRLPNPGPDGTWDGVDDDYGDLRLQAGSPCIDRGDPAFVAQTGEIDLEGHARVLCGRVDMGAFEFGIGDYDCDQVVDFADFSSWQACMTGPLDSGAFHSTIDNRHSTIGCESFDFDGDGSVSLLDFSGFQRVFAP